MKQPHLATAVSGAVVAILGVYSLFNSLTKREGAIHLTLIAFGMALLPLSFFVVQKPKD